MNTIGLSLKNDAHTADRSIRSGRNLYLINLYNFFDYFFIQIMKLSYLFTVGQPIIRTTPYSNRSKGFRFFFEFRIRKAIFFRVNGSLFKILDTLLLFELSLKIVAS